MKASAVKAISLLTINAISRDMNGAIPFTNLSGHSQSFTLLAPEENFIIWISFLAGGAEIDPGGLRVTSSEFLGGGAQAGGVDPGENLGDRFQVDLSAGLAVLGVGSTLRFSAGLHTITARVYDTLGNLSDPVSYTFETSPPTVERRPFEEPDRWFLNFQRDNFTITSDINSQGTVTVNSSPGPNGVADFVEDLRILGLQSESPPQPAKDAGLNQLVLQVIKETVKGRLNELYSREFDGSANPDSVRIEFFLTPPATPYSRIGIGGDDPLPGYTIGRAEYDYKNHRTNDDSPSDLGIFTTNLIGFYINSSYTFRSRFNPLIPGRGVPLGFNPLDVIILGPSFNRNDPSNSKEENQRFDDIAIAIDSIARVTAVILAHEIGHSVGLVANGPPPRGLFGGEYLASFAGPYTTSLHLDTDENDIMASALSFLDAIKTGLDGPAFNLMNLAYLRERILLE